MDVLNPNSTGYVHPDEPNLLNIHKAMKYNATGEPQVQQSNTNYASLSWTEIK